VTTLSISHTIEIRVLNASGSTNLPDGAFVDVRVIRLESGDAPATEQGAGPSPFAKVRAGAFAATVDLSTWPAGTVELLGLFEIDSAQPSSIVAAYGADGERLDGPAVVDSMSDGRYLEVRDDYELR
jgi:hypothetical protein